MDSLSKYWQGLQPRERWMLGGGGVFCIALIAHQLVWQPWQNAIDYMEEALIGHRVNLVWMQQYAEQIETGNVSSQVRAIRGRDQSLMSIIEQSAKTAGVRESIQQLMPRENNTQVSVVLEEASFNKWVAWVDILQNQYGVTITQLNAEREDKPDQAEIRVTFTRD
jgi:general secretion pathway protein M